MGAGVWLASACDVLRLASVAPFVEVLATLDASFTGACFAGVAAAVCGKASSLGPGAAALSVTKALTDGLADCVSSLFN